MRQQIHRFDQNLTNWIVATFGHASRPFFEFMTMLGDPTAIVLVTIGVITTGLYQSAMGIAISGAIIPATLLIGAILKILFERARPMTEYAMNMKIKTFSFPSGHSSGSTIAYGLLAYIALMSLPAPLNLIAGGVLAVIPIFVGMSRVYLGAHFPSDVLAGWALGLLALLIVIFGIGPLR